MADILNPNLPGVSVSPYPPEMQQDAANIQRRRAIADMLLMRSMQPMQQPTGYGGIPVPISPLAGLAHVAQGALGGLAESRISGAEGELATKYSAGLADARKRIAEAITNRDYTGAAQIAGQWPVLRTQADALFQQSLPKPELTSQFTLEGGEQRGIVDLHNPTAPLTTIGGVKTPPVHAVPLGGTTDLVNPNTGATVRTLPHTIDPNRIATPEDIEANARLIAEYRAPGLTGAGGRSNPNSAAIMRRVTQLNPTYDASIFPVVKHGEDLFNNKNAPQVRAFGTLVGHVKAAKDLYAALENPTDVNRINAARNFFLEEFGYPAPAALDTARPFIAAEAVKAVTGGPGSVEDRKVMADRLSKAQSPAAFNAAADTIIQYGTEQLKGHLQQLKGMTKGKRGEGEFAQYLTPQAKEAFLKYGGSLNAGRRAADLSGGAEGAGGLPSQSDIDAELKRRGL